MNTFRDILAFAAAAAVFFGAAAASRTRAEAHLAGFAMPDEVSFLPDKAIVKTFSLGQDELIADYYWLKAIQYFGDQENATPERLKYLHPLIDLVTDLAPEFEYAYRFGATTLVLRDTNGDLASAILKKGIVNFPDNCRMPYLLGFVEYYVNKAPAAAAVWYDHTGQTAARVGVKDMVWTSELARKLRLDAKDADLMIPVLEHMARNEPDPVLRDRAFERWRTALRKSKMRFLQSEIDAFFKNEGRYPADFAELREKGYISTPPVDPLGGRLSIIGGKVTAAP
ncbi:MAG: hypothetical protein HY897_10125 [Deltaproteobacteria bacterium]|nr:hypothetical protein [Deltaproteobacteria bacterium]